MEEAIRELRGEPQRHDYEPELRLGVPAYVPDSFVPDENERLVLYRRMARAATSEDLDEVREEMRDRFGPVPTLVENLIAAMNIRRRMKELMVLSALLKGDQMELKFHPDAPVDPQALAALANANRDTMRLTPSYQVIVLLKTGNYEQLFAQIDGVLQALATCEKLENQPNRPPGPMLN
jgi:transcription-repair coupling factor (superfamily II helicase)